MSLNRNARGEIVPLGRVAHRAYWTPAFGDPLPTWITLPVGTGAIQTANAQTAPANYRASTAATANAAARLRCAPWSGSAAQFMAPGQYEEIIWTLFGLRFEADSGWYVRFELGNDSQAAGLDLRQDDGAATAKVRTHLDSTTFLDRSTYIQLQKPDGGSTKPRNLTLRWRPRTREFYVLQDDQVLTAVTYAAGEINLANLIYAQVTFNTSAATSQAFRFQATELVLRSN